MILALNAEAYSKFFLFFRVLSPSQAFRALAVDSNSKNKIPVWGNAVLGMKLKRGKCVFW